MKKIPTLVVASVLSLSATAQSIPARFQHQLNSPAFAQQLKQLLLQKQLSGGLHKTTTVKKRVVAESGFDLTATPSIMTDSARYKYSGSNGSLYYPGAYSYGNYYPSIISIGGGGDNYDNVPVMADSIANYAYDASGPSFSLTDLTGATYTSAGKVNTYDYSVYGTSPDHYKYINTYNSQGHLSKMLELNYNTATSQWDSSGLYKYLYNLQGNVIVDSLYSYDINEADWSLWGVINHTYDGAGNELQTALSVDIGIGWTVVFKGDMQYNSANQMTRIILSQYMSSLTPYSKDSFQYTTGVDFATKGWSYDYSGSAWTPSYYNTTSINSQMMPDSVTYYTWNTATSGYDKSTVTVFKYDTDNNPVTWNEYAVTGSTLSDQSKHNFYYENYTVSGIKDVARADIKLYPNPVKNTINLSWKDGVGKNVQIDIRNTAGQLVHQEGFTWMQAKESISLGDVAPGLYWMSVKETNGTVFTQQIVKE